MSATSRLSPQFLFQLSPIGSLRFEFDTVTAFGLHSWVHCVRLSGCFSLPASDPLVSPTLANGFRSLDACLHWSLFACLPVWLSTSGGVRLCGCLFFAFTCFPSCFSYHLSPDLNICLPTHPFSIISLPGGGWFFCLFAFARVFHRLFLTMCLPLHGSSHSYVPLVAVSCSCFSTFSFVISPLSLFFSPFVSSSSFRCYTSIDPPRQQ